MKPADPHYVPNTARREPYMLAMNINALREVVCMPILFALPYNSDDRGDPEHTLYTATGLDIRRHTMESGAIEEYLVVTIGDNPDGIVDQRDVLKEYYGGDGGEAPPVRDADPVARTLTLTRA